MGNPELCSSFNIGVCGSDTSPAYVGVTLFWRTTKFSITVPISLGGRHDDLGKCNSNIFGQLSQSICS